MRILPLIAGSVLLCAPAKADKFWMADPKTEQNAPAGSSPNYIEGVLVASSDEGYHVRIVGGEIVLPKASVFKIEKDALTLDAIIKAEQAAKKTGELANEERRLTQTIQRRERDVQIAEASARRSARPVDAVVSRSAPTIPAFDPVLGIAGSGFASHQLQMANARATWKLTRNRRYLKLLRQLRRQY